MLSGNEEVRREDEAHEAAFERWLSDGLAPVDAPTSFEERLFARVDAEASGPTSRGSVFRREGAFETGQRWAIRAIAAATIMGVLTGGERWERRAVRRKMATQEFEVSMRIADRALEHTRQQLRQAGVEDQ